MNAQPVVYDIVIVGAGIVGSALACALAKSSFNIAIVEAQEGVAESGEQPDSVDGFDARVSAITVASQQLLQDIGAWKIIAENRLSPYRYMHVWDAEGTGSIDFDADDINQSVLGHIVENRLTVAALLAVHEIRQGCRPSQAKQQPAEKKGQPCNGHWSLGPGPRFLHQIYEVCGVL